MGAKAMREPVTIKNIMFSGDAGSPCKLLSGGTKLPARTRRAGRAGGVSALIVCFMLAPIVLNAHRDQGGAPGGEG